MYAPIQSILADDTSRKGVRHLNSHVGSGLTRTVGFRQRAPQNAMQ